MSKSRRMMVPIEIADDDREAFARYCGRRVSDNEIRERLSAVLRAYLHDAVGTGR